MNREWLVSTAIYFVALVGISALDIYRRKRLVARHDRQKDAAFAEGVRTGARMTVESLKRVGIVPPTLEVDCDVFKYEPADAKAEKAGDKDFLRSLKIKP